MASYFHLGLGEEKRQERANRATFLSLPLCVPVFFGHNSHSPESPQVSQPGSQKGKGKLCNVWRGLAQSWGNSVSCSSNSKSDYSGVIGLNITKTLKTVQWWGWSQQSLCFYFCLFIFVVVLLGCIFPFNILLFTTLWQCF